MSQEETDSAAVWLAHAFELTTVPPLKFEELDRLGRFLVEEDAFGHDLTFSIAEWEKA